MGSRWLRSDMDLRIRSRRLILPLLAASAMFGTQVSAQDYPTRTIRLIVPFTPGAGTDTTARILAQKIAPILGQAVVVENRGGASGAIGTDIAAKAAPDGYTWVLGTDPPFTINQHLRKLPYDPMHDFAPVSLLATVPLVLVANPSVKADSLKDLIALAKAAPGKLTMALSGNGTSGHLAAAAFMAATGTDFYHVPFRGQAEAVNDVVAGRLDLNFSAIPNVFSLAEAGKLKILAIGAPKRFTGLPGVPTIAESGYPDFDVSAFHALLMPASTPPAIVRKVNAAVVEVLRMPDVSSRFEGMGLYPVGSTPGVLATFLETESARWAKVIKEAGIKDDGT
jgi:tripartite-type tricarboxylate transporter receptor subunit TctC